MVVLVVGGFFAVQFYKESQKPIDISRYIKIQAHGYNKSGTVELAGSYQKKIKQIIADKKSDQKQKYLNDVKITLDKNRNLSNGQKVVAHISTSIEDNPIQSGKKTLIVKGLSPIPKIINLDEVLSSLDSRVRSQFTVNSAYRWDITRLDNLYFISGSITDTNTNSEAESVQSPVPEKAFSLLSVYHFDGTGSVNSDDNGYVLAGNSNVTLDHKKLVLSSITEDKQYWHFGDGGTDLTVGFLNWIQTFATEQEVTDWLKTNYPAAIKL